MKGKNFFNPQNHNIYFGKIKISKTLTLTKEKIINFEKKCFDDHRFRHRARLPRVYPTYLVCGGD